MKCPACQSDNREEAKFCLKCGHEFEFRCPQCGKVFPFGAIFCDGCGHRLEKISKAEKPAAEVVSERKHITVLFSDLSGYTAMTEKLDPEEVKKITSRIFGRISEVIAKYEGFVEKYIGDAVVALFGVLRTYEDDPVRAIRAAREIHELVVSESPQIAGRIGRPLAMHSGINTGPVVTGEVEMKKGTHGVVGNTINLASRLQGLAKAGEILVGWETYRQSEGHFNFEELEPTKVKGKEEHVRIYRVLSPKEVPSKIRRLQGLRADLIGRSTEIDQLEKALNNLRKGKGTIFSISGDAGTGKSRLVDEFKATLDLEEIQWLEGHCYPYSQNTAYFPLIDFLDRIFQIREGDPPPKIRERIESGIGNLVGGEENIIPYVGSLYALRYPEAENVSPEYWKSRLMGATQTILSALAKRAPTVFCLEDLHWADPSFTELLRNTLVKIRDPAIVLCVYRPDFNLFKDSQLEEIGKSYQKIRLGGLLPSESQRMLESLLKTVSIPEDLKRLVQDKAEGNPFYLEELVNSLIESDTLIRNNGDWGFSKPIGDLDISSTIHGVIAGRLDRLEKRSKRILQEASVIGRVFPYEILKRITGAKKEIDPYLKELEAIDLIRTRAPQPNPEYMFKHALTQEVVYNGLLKTEREKLHERIALVMEQVFQDRLPEFYETLAFHFKQGQSVLKAIDYLMKSGEKSLKRYAVEESHRSYSEAFRLLNNKVDKSDTEQSHLIGLVLEWCQVFYYRGDAIGLVELLQAHEDLALSIGDKDRVGMLYAWFGYVLFWREKYKESYDYLTKALRFGEETKNGQLIAYACTWLPYTCAELGLFDEGIQHGKRAQDISKTMSEDRYLYIKSLSGIGYIHFFRGERKELLQLSKYGLEYGKRHSDLRSLGMSHTGIGLSHLIAGDFTSAIECCKKAVLVSEDPIYSMAFRTMLSFSYLSGSHFQEAEDTAQEVLSFVQRYGVDWLGTMVRIVLGVVLIAKGHMGQGLKKLKELQPLLISNESKWLYAQSEYILGNVYLQIVEGTEQRSLLLLVKNIGFLIKNVPFAHKKAEDHFNKAIEAAGAIGANGILGQAHLGLGLLHKAKKKKGRARECVSYAIQIFEQCDAEVFLAQAKEVLESLR